MILEHRSRQGGTAVISYHLVLFYGNFRDFIASGAICTVIYVILSACLAMGHFYGNSRASIASGAICIGNLRHSKRMFAHALKMS